MPETDNIAQMASKVVSKTLKAFGWETCGPANHSWKCPTPKLHRVKNSHPSDVVFRYDDPYESHTVFVNTDLKSFGANSFSQSSLTSTIRNLIRATNCAQTNEEWQRIYTGDEMNFQLVSLLFIYNHDDALTKDFDALVRVAVEELDEQPLSPMTVFGPERVLRLAEISDDITRFRAEQKVPHEDRILFFAPDIALDATRASDGKWWPCATFEDLTSPWIAMGFGPDYPLTIYYLGPGEKMEEFQFLLEFCKRSLLLDGRRQVQVRHLNSVADPEASVHFEDAKRFLAKVYNSQEFKQRLDSVSYYPVPEIRVRFSNLQVGMESRPYE